MISTRPHQVVGDITILATRVAGTIVSGETLGGNIFVTFFVSRVAGTIVSGETLGGVMFISLLVG